MHYDEAFSSLQVADHKGFLRLRITPRGDLELFALALDRAPLEWREDPRWRTPSGGGNRDVPAHRAKHPSRWVGGSGWVGGWEWVGGWVQDGWVGVGGWVQDEWVGGWVGGCSERPTPMGE